MSKELNDLQQPFQQRAVELLTACEQQGCIMRPVHTVRSPAEQARLWRQNRTTAEITRACARLEGAGAPWLAQVLRGVGPQYGDWATNALPGESWHQWGLALDCYWEVDGQVEWSTELEISVAGHVFNGYKLYANLAEQQYGLTSLGPSMGDWGHVQANPFEVRDMNAWASIEAAMRSMFPEGGEED